MKKLLLIFAVALLSSTSWAQFGDEFFCVNGIWYERMPEEGCYDCPPKASVVGIHTLDYYGYDEYPVGMAAYKGDIVIPQVVKYMGEQFVVESIAPCAFQGDEEYDDLDGNEMLVRPISDLTSVTLPATLSRIGERAFANCCKLTSIKIPSGVYDIGDAAFELCENLKTVHIDDLNSWSSIYFSDEASNPLSQGGALYVKGQKVTDLVFPDGLYVIESYAYYGCSSITSVNIPNSVIRIGDNVFGKCQNLTSVELHCGYVGPWFSGYPIKNLILGNEVISIGDFAFRFCNQLSTVTIPNSVTSIGKSAFESCSGLTAVTLSSKLSEIGDQAFFGCKNIKEVTALCKRPTPITANVFPYRSTQKLYVPKGYVNAYEAADYWWQFFDIVELGSSELEGDMNGDGTLTITDALIIINMILGK